MFLIRYYKVEVIECLTVSCKVGRLILLYYHSTGEMTGEAVVERGGEMKKTFLPGFIGQEC